jgi:hypothetical protein|tara:strand:+ start:8298 stop:8924 length:627 start_codon:yes stop_codon:yes gene_type:complete
MTTINSISRQPTQQDYASPSQFKFSIAKLPKVEFFCTEVNIPGINLGNAVQLTTLKDIPLPGTKLEFGDLSLTFLVDEKFDNFEEIYTWLRSLGFPADHSEYANLIEAGRDRFPTQGKELSGVSKFAGREGTAVNVGASLSDATLSILSAKNNVIKEVRFTDIFPTGLSGVGFSTQATDVQYLTSTVNFKYTLYDFAEPGKKSTLTQS